MDGLEQLIKYTKDIKVLYVEDDKEARESIRDFLDVFFDEIVVAVDGEDGLQKFKDSYSSPKKIDFIITDLNMPKLTGIQMIDKIRDLDTKIPIFVLSAYNKTIEIENSVKLNIGGYLFKPIDQKQFVSKLCKITNRIVKDKVDMEFKSIERSLS